MSSLNEDSADHDIIDDLGKDESISTKKPYVLTDKRKAALEKARATRLSNANLRKQKREAEIKRIKNSEKMDLVNTDELAELKSLVKSLIDKKNDIVVDELDEELPVKKPVRRKIKKVIVPELSDVESTDIEVVKKPARRKVKKVVVAN